jgi:hypothetical protein
MRVLSLVVALVASLPTATVMVQAQDQYLDRFNYYETRQRDDGFTDYGPSDWGDISCDERNALDECVGYPDKWNTGRDWDITENSCRWCPATDNNNANCGRHHQSPINLERYRAILGNVNEKECIDVHWIFAYLGLFLFNDNVWNWHLNLTSILSCVSSRAVMVAVFNQINEGVPKTTTTNMHNNRCDTKYV